MLRKFLVLLSLLGVCERSISFNYIVFDPKNLAEAQKHFGMLQSQLDELVEQKEKLQTQIGQLDTQYQATVGENDFLGIFEQKNSNGSDYFDWISTLDELQKNIQSGIYDPTNEISVRVQEYNKIYGMPHPPEVFVPHDPESYSAQWQAEQALAVREGLSVSDTAFDKADGINTHIKKLREKGYEVYSQKEALDYGNNIQLYLVTLMNEMMRLQAHQLRLMAVTENETSQVNDFNSRFFNTNFLK